MGTYSEWSNLSRAAWAARENARIIGKTKVGAAVLSEEGNIYSGCNIEHAFWYHDIHAEVNTIGSMITSGDRSIKKILVVSEEHFLPPCGGCMDWIMQFLNEDTLVGVQNSRDGDIEIFLPRQLMPYYPG